MDKIDVLQEDVQQVANELIRKTKPNWYNICFDVILAVGDLSDTKKVSDFLQTEKEGLCNTYALLGPEFDLLFSLPQFISYMKDVYEQYTISGASVHTMQFQALAMSMAEDVYQRVYGPQGETKDKLKALELFAKYGHLDPASNGVNKAAENNSSGSSTTVNVVIPPGIKGLENMADYSLVLPTKVGDSNGQ